MLVIGCIEANFFKKICVGKLSPRSTQCTPLQRSQSAFFVQKSLNFAKVLPYVDKSIKCSLLILCMEYFAGILPEFAKDQRTGRNVRLSQGHPTGSPQFEFWRKAFYTARPRVR